MISWPSGDQINSGLRHVYTSVASIVGTLAVVGVVTQGDATTISNAVHKIGECVSSIIAGVSALIPIVSAAYAMWSTSQRSRMVAIAKSPEVTQIVVTSQGLANSIPNSKVVSE